MELNQFDWLTNLRAFWDFAVRLHEGGDFFITGHDIHSIIGFVKTCYPHISRMGFVMKGTEISVARVTMVDYISEETADEFEEAYQEICQKNGSRSRCVNFGANQRNFWP